MLGPGTCWTPSLWPGGPWVQRFALRSATLQWPCARQVFQQDFRQGKIQSPQAMYQKDERSYPSFYQHLQKCVADSAATCSWETDWWPAISTKAPEKSPRAWATTCSHLSTAVDSGKPSFGLSKLHLSKLACTTGNPLSRTPAGTDLHKFSQWNPGLPFRSAVHTGSQDYLCCTVCADRIWECNLFRCSYLFLYLFPAAHAAAQTLAKRVG